MLQRLSLALALATLIVASAAAQAVVRFETTMGDFDMVLNPTNNSRLQGNVNNILAYVNADRYRGVWINRADTGFVLQMGGFYSHTKRPSRTVEDVQAVAAFPTVQGAPNIPGLSNTTGTVSLALSGSSPDTGTSSFFINIGNNGGLDNQFTVLGAIADMTVVNQIMALSTLDRTQDPAFDAGTGMGGAGNLTYTDVPLQTDGKQVFITRTFQVLDPITIAKDLALVNGTMAASAAASGGGSGGSSSAANTAISAPEPTSAALLLSSLGALLLGRRRRS